MKKSILTKYADLALKTGVNLQKKQHLVITAPVETVELVRIISKRAYKMGAGQVHILWLDDDITFLNYKNVEEKKLSTVPEWERQRIQYLMDNKAARLVISCTQPGLMDSVNPVKIGRITAARQSDEMMRKYRRFSMSGQVQWTIIAHPSKRWAKKVYPDLKPNEAYKKLWDAILAASRVNEDSDAVANWESHNTALSSRSRYLNEQRFDSLHFKNNAGTDLIVGLVDDHQWEGGADYSADNIRYNPNIPTEENFTMPHCLRVNGRVVSTMPLNYQGQLIDKFHLDFKDGKVVSGKAEVNDDLLQSLLNVDEGARRLGEVALIPYDSPINNTKTLFFNTLFDENASCHLALGASYTTNIKNGNSLSVEEISARGGNQSVIHEDFMFGSADMNVTGIKKDGSKVLIIKNGNFLFS